MLAAVASVAVCAIETRATFAQSASQAKQPAYYISEFELSDPEGIKPYSQQVEATITPFSGRYLGRGGQTATLEGEQPKRIVAWHRHKLRYDSPAYRAIRPIRLQSAKSRVYIVEGAPEVR